MIMVTVPIARAPTPSIAGQNREEAARGTFRSSVGRPSSWPLSDQCTLMKLRDSTSGDRTATVDRLFMGERSLDVSITCVERANGTVRTLSGNRPIGR